MSDIQEQQKILYKRAEENDKEQVCLKVSMPLFEEKELEIFDNNIHSIIEEYSKLHLEKKDQILTQRIIIKQEQEINRLNNIIDELEKWLEEQHQFIIEIPAYTKDISIEHKTMEICYENILDKLNELKGDNK